jgi:hypothetical protein
MSDQKFFVLKSESVQRLRRQLQVQPENYESSLDDLVALYNLSFVETAYSVSDGIELSMPIGIKQSENMDSKNCQTILEILPKLTPAQATDERLWVTLCFGKYAAYVKERWPFRSTDDIKLTNHVVNHWFANTIRGRMRNNGIARLWWMGYTAQRIPQMSIEDVYEILFANSDYRSSLLERNSSANSINVLVAVLKVTSNAYEEGISYNRESFRKFMGKVDTLGGRSNLAAIDVDALVDLLAPIYKESYKISVE